MRIFRAVAAVLLVTQAMPALADRDPYSGAPLPPATHEPASPITDHFYIRAAFYTPKYNTSFRVDPTNAPPGTTGTPVSAEKCAVKIGTRLDRATAGEGETVALHVSVENKLDKGHGMAVAVIGGLITSTALTLVIVPAAFSVIDDIERWFGPKFGRFLVAPPPSPAPAPSQPHAAA